MGCFDYQCECKGKHCGHTGGQSCGANVYIEAPLSDGTNVYLKGYYEEYGYVLVYDDDTNETYFFYLKEFEECFEGWFNRDSAEKLDKSFLATKVWTDYELSWATDKYGYELEKTISRNCFNHVEGKQTYLTSKILKQCIRADKGLNIRSAEQKKKDLIEEYQELVNSHKTTMEFYQKKLDALTKECP